MVRIPPPPLPFTDRVSTSEKNSLVFCLIYRLLLSKIQGFYKYIIAESCCSISLIFDFLEKGPIFHFWTAYAVLAKFSTKSQVTRFRHLMINYKPLKSKINNNNQWKSPSLKLSFKYILASYVFHLMMEAMITSRNMTLMVLTLFLLMKIWQRSMSLIQLESQRKHLKTFLVRSCILANTVLKNLGRKVI